MVGGACSVASLERVGECPRGLSSCDVMHGRSTAGCPTQERGLGFVKRNKRDPNNSSDNIHI